MSNDTSVGRNIDVDGVRLYVEQHGAGDPLVLVHGGTVSSAMWEPTVLLLADHFQVTVVDTRGHGRSTNPCGERSRIISVGTNAKRLPHTIDGSRL